MADCAGCFNKVTDGRFLNCHNCQKSYCLHCTNYTEEFLNFMGPAQRYSWKCVECKSAEPKLDNTNTPLRGISDNVNMHRGAARPCGAVSNEHDNSVMDVSYTDNQRLNDTTRLDMNGASDIQQLVAELRLFREEMRAMRQHIQALRARVTLGMEDHVLLDHALESNTTSVSVGENTEASLADTVAQLRLELNDRDQDMLLNDVEISNVPEQSGENTLHIVATLGQKLGVTLSEHDIVDATRVGRAPRLDEGTQGQPARPRLLVVRLARRAVRDRLLQAARVRRGATTEGTGLPGPDCRFYVNERLTFVNRRLFQKARQLKEHYGWRYVWTRDGRIYVRQRPGTESPRHRIRTELDLSRVFGTLDI
ncbi:uncharacterized protein LOC134805403 [Cydia splendana]|uniref:uncharacterized protein LOC134805403 n=1 Tax=Cydia splendana TaxID=1100963 RepID=UPI00300C7A21